MLSSGTRVFLESLRSPWLRLLLISAALLGAACGKTTEKDSVTPSVKRDYNVILISLDTLRADHLHVDGYPREVSPNIDRFARGAVRFERAYSHAPWTTPAHGAMLTSLYPTALGLKKTFPDCGRIADSVETMAEYFKANGYATHAVTEGGMVHAQFGFGQGFDKYFQSARHVDQGIQATLDWLKEHKDERFFFFYHTYDIHRYNPPEEYRKLYVSPGPHRLAIDKALAEKVQLYENADFVRSLDEADLAYLIDLYDASIRWVDRYLGILFEYLERSGLLDTTVVVVTSDHGEEFLERSRTGHGYTNYEEQIRVPLIIHHPDAAPGVRKEMFRHIDLLPTLADSVGLPARREWLGESLFPLLLRGDSEASGKNRVSFGECGYSNLRSLQTLKWKLIYNYGSGKVELYDLVRDPVEKHSVVEENEPIARQFKALLDRIIEKNELLKRGFGGTATEAGDLPEDLLEDLKRLGYTK